ncbi:Myb DNA-bind 3 domain-containing protein [Abeliophyllum distichum]|uniref:Myb DNA-bind 3 domain-containing protein n=1 Tax=Abeliophyllum distichum TaxID=126358 RepID=A0ABD1UFC4_9LAMI
MDGHRDKTKEPMSWSDENEHVFIGILYDNVKSGKLQCSTFTKDEWSKINLDMIVVTKSDNVVERLKGKWNHLRKVHRLFSELLGHTSVTWDLNTNQVNAAEEVWQHFYTINKTKYKLFREEGCKHYELLGEIFGRTTTIGGLCNASTTLPPTSEEERTLYLKEKLARIQEKSSNQSGVSEATSSDPHSNMVCPNILNNMEGVSNYVYMKAIKVFKDPDFRISFVMMPKFRRGPILELL